MVLTCVTMIVTPVCRVVEQASALLYQGSSIKKRCSPTRTFVEQIRGSRSCKEVRDVDPAELWSWVSPHGAVCAGAFDSFGPEVIVQSLRVWDPFTECQLCCRCMSPSEGSGGSVRLQAEHGVH